MTAGTLPASDFFPLSEAARYFPRPGGRKVSVKTLYRWASRGMRRGKLRTVKLGQQVCTCDEWVRAFIADLNDPSAEHVNEVTLSKTETGRRESVARELDRLGI
jgi:Protein of unknown function (DUF1580)